MATTDMTFRLIPDENASSSFNSAVEEFCDGLKSALANRSCPLRPIGDGTVTTLDITSDFTLVQVHDPVGVQEGGMSEVALMDMVVAHGGENQLGLNELGQHVIRL